MIEEIRQRLLEEADQEYKLFSEKINPGARNILGVRVPFLRQISKEILRNDWEDYIKELACNSGLYFEEKMLWGLLIGNASMPLEKRMEQIRAFLPQIDNWAICDICTGDLKFARKEPARTAVWESLIPLFDSEEEFEVRFGVTMAMSHYLTEDYLDRFLKVMTQINHPGYYARMGVAWAVSICYIKFPDLTKPILTEYKLKDPWTHNKTIQKIKESYRVPASEKSYLSEFVRHHFPAAGGSELSI